MENRPANRYTYELKTVSIRCCDSQPAEEDTIKGDPIAGDPETAEKIIRSILSNLDEDQEHFGILAMDGVHRVIGFKILSSGTRNQTPVDPARLFRVALQLEAAGLILFHNHPSGQLEPSRDDLDLTKRIVKAGNIIGIGVNDHVITGRGDDSLSLRRSRPALFAAC